MTLCTSTLRLRVDEAADKPERNGRHTTERDGSCEKDNAGDSQGKLVQCADHGVRGRGRGSNAPSRAVRDEDSCHARVDDPDAQALSRLDREVSLQILSRPVFDEKRGHKQNGSAEQIVVKHDYQRVVSEDVPRILVRDTHRPSCQNSSS